MHQTKKSRCTVVSPAGEKILYALARIGKTQAWLADEVGITPAYVSLLIQGKNNNPTLNVIKKINATLNVIIW